MAVKKPVIKPASYCELVWQLEAGNPNIHYHDHEYGFPIHDDNELFARLILEINQAGLSWITILRKKEHFFTAFDQFEIDKVARYTEKKVAQLLQDPGIIRNRLKVNATIENAKRIRQLQKEAGSFEKWLLAQHPLPKDEWVKLFKKTFLFTGGEIVNEFLVSTGFLPGAHIPTCSVYKKVLQHEPGWLQAKK